ncbi:substrate-binding domain-containing protein [Actinomycetes bacterium KLBMP 9797]
MTGSAWGGHRRGRRRGELTVATIARLSGVSATTVSKVLNGHAGVAADTRQRVETMLREHGYRRPQVTEPAAAVEVVFYGLESDLAIQVLHGVERVARQHDLAVGFTDVATPEHATRTWSDQLLTRRPLGVIAVHSSFTPEQHGRLAVSGIPLVALDPMGEPAHATPSVGATNWSGGVTATRHLLDLGHRRIAVIGGPVEYLCARARLEACRATLDTAGVPLDPRLVRTGSFFFDDGLRAGVELLALPDRPTAVLCGNDLQAFGVYEAARRAGLRIPDDLSVVGFDDIDGARWCPPPLTTVRQPFTEMGEAATHMLQGLVSGKVSPQARVELATTLVVRASTAPPPA